MLLRLFAAWTAVALGALGSVSPAFSAPLDLSHVPADAKWLAHIDAEALRSSPVMSAFLEHCLKGRQPGNPTEASHTDPCAALPLDKVQSVTLFGTRLGIRNGAAIVQGKWDQEELLGKLKAQSDVKHTGDGAGTVYTWTKHKGTDLAHEVALAFPKPGVLVYAASTDELNATITRLDGKGDSLAGKKSPLAAEVPPGTVVLARATGLHDEDVGPQFPLFLALHGFDYHLSDHDGRLVEELTVEARTEATARRMKRVLDGSVALMQLAFHGHTELVEILDDAKITAEGRRVRSYYEGSSEKVARMMPRVCRVLREEWLSRLGMIQRMLGDKATSGEGKPSGR